MRRPRLLLVTLCVAGLCLSAGCAGPQRIGGPEVLATADLGGQALPATVTLKPWWKEADASPGEDAILVFAFKDTAKAPTIVLGFNGIGGGYGYNYAGQFGGAGDGQDRTAMVFLSRALIARHEDGYAIRFQGPKPDSVEKVEVVKYAESLKREAIHQARAARAAHVAAMQKEFKEDPFKPEGDLGEVATEFRQKGFIPYARSWNDDVYPRSVPKEQERGAKPLRAYATPGEFEPIQAAVYALKDLTFTARISDLTGPGVLKADKDVAITPIECTAVRSGGGSSVKQWQVKPAWLRTNEPQPVKAGTSKAWYITVHVPKNAKPGDYKGTFTLSAEGAGQAEFPVTFKVLPFTLDKAPAFARGAYIAGPVDGEYIQNMLDHSLNAASTWPGSYFAPKIVDGQCVSETTPEMDRYLKKLQAAGFVQMIYFGGGDPRYNNPAGLVRATGAEVGTPEFAKYYGEYWLDLVKQQKVQGWPELVCCPFDEPVKSAEKIRNYEICYDIVKKVLPDMRVWCVFMNRGGSAKTIGQKAEIWSCNGGFEQVQAQKKADAAKGVERLIYTYTVCCVNQRPGNARFNPGFNPWKYDADGSYFWAYLWYTNDPFNDLDGDVTDWTPAARDCDGRIYNTVAWEGWREGLDDRLYVETCLRMARDKGRKDILEKMDELKKEIAAGTESEHSQRTSGLDDFFFQMDDASRLDVYRARVVAMILQMVEQK